MSEVALLIIGSLIFAITTVATVFAGGVSFNRVAERDRLEREQALRPIALSSEPAPPS